MQDTKLAALKTEIIDIEDCIGLRIFEERLNITLAGNVTGEFNGMEVDEVEDISEVYVLEVDEKRILLTACGLSVDYYVLFSVGDLKMVYVEKIMLVSEM